MSASSELTRTVEEFRAQIDDRQSQQAFEMAQRYLDIERAIAARIDAVVERLAREKAEGKVVSEYLLSRVEHWTTLQREVWSELSHFNGWASDFIAAERVKYGSLGVDAATAQLRDVGVSLTGLGAGAVEGVTAATAGGPLADLLAKAYPDVAQAMAQSLVRGVGLGVNPKQVAADMRDDLGVGLDRALTIARTEELRAYNTSTLDAFRESGVVEYQRMATLDENTCMGCLCADGEILESADDWEMHPQCRCTAVPIVTEVGPPLESDRAETWFAGQSEEEQLAQMGPGRFDLYSAGDVSWSDMWTRTESDTWGTAIVPTSVSDLQTIAAGTAAVTTE